MRDTPTSTTTDGDDGASPLTALCEAAQQTSSMTTLQALIQKTTSSPTIFTGYQQLYDICQSKRITNNSSSSSATTSMDETYLQTLELFSYGTVQDYVDHPTRYTVLNEAQTFKLQQLTILSIVAQHILLGWNTNNNDSIPDSMTTSRSDIPTSTNRSSSSSFGFLIPYRIFQQALSLPDNNNTTTTSSSTVEDLLISCIDSHVLVGQLCQQSQAIVITGPCVARDVALSQIPTMLQQLTLFQTNCQIAQDELQHDLERLYHKDSLEQSFWKTAREQIKRSERTAAGIVVGKDSRLLAQPPQWATTTTTTTTTTVGGGGGSIPTRRPKRSRGGLSATPPDASLGR